MNSKLAKNGGHKNTVSFEWQRDDNEQSLEVTITLVSIWNDMNDLVLVVERKSQFTCHISFVEKVAQLEAAVTRCKILGKSLEIEKLKRINKRSTIQKR